MSQSKRLRYIIYTQEFVQFVKKNLVFHKHRIEEPFSIRGIEFFLKGNDTRILYQ